MLRPLQYKTYLANASKLLASTGGAQLNGLAIAPVLTRLYTPEHFGAFGVYSTILSVLAIVGCLRYEFAITLPSRERAGRAMFRICIIVTMLTTIAAALVLIPFGPVIAAYYNIGEFAYLVGVIPVALCSTALFQAQSNWAVREHRYGDLAFAKLGQSIPQAIGQLAFGLFGVGPAGLVAGEIIGRASGNMLLLIRGQHANRPRRHLSARQLCKLAIHYRDFPIFSTGSALLNQASLLIPLLFISKFYGLQAAGQYALVQRVLALPMNLLGQTISTLYIAEATSLWRSKKPGLRSLVWKTAWGGMALGIVPGAVLIGYGPELFVWVFGKDWLQAGVFSQVLALAFIVRMAISPVSQTLAILGKQPHQLLVDGLRLMSVIAVFFVYKKPHEIIYALIGYSIVTVAFQIMQMIVIDRNLQGPTR